jgi:hypothetical protein
MVSNVDYNSDEVKVLRKLIGCTKCPMRWRTSELAMGSYEDVMLKIDSDDMEYKRFDLEILATVASLLHTCAHDETIAFKAINQPVAPHETRHISIKAKDRSYKVSLMNVGVSFSNHALRRIVCLNDSFYWQPIVGVTICPSDTHAECINITVNIRMKDCSLLIPPTDYYFTQASLIGMSPEQVQAFKLLVATRDGDEEGGEDGDHHLDERDITSPMEVEKVDSTRTTTTNTDMDAAVPIVGELMEDHIPLPKHTPEGGEHLCFERERGFLGNPLVGAEDLTNVARLSGFMNDLTKSVADYAGFSQQEIHSPATIQTNEDVYVLTSVLPPGSCVTATMVSKITQGMLHSTDQLVTVLIGVSPGRLPNLLVLTATMKKIRYMVPATSVPYDGGACASLHTTDEHRICNVMTCGVIRRGIWISQQIGRVFGVHATSQPLLCAPASMFDAVDDVLRRDRDSTIENVNNQLSDADKALLRKSDKIRAKLAMTSTPSNGTSGLQGRTRNRNSQWSQPTSSTRWCPY